LFVWGGTIFGKDTFYLNRVRLEGLHDIQADDLDSIILDHLKERNWLFIRHAHRFFLNTKELEHKIRSRYGLESITFQPHWPSHSLLITVKEKEGILAYSVNDSYFAIDRQGTVIRKFVSPEEAKSLQAPVIYQYEAGVEPQIGQQVLKPADIDALLQLYSGLSKYPNFSIHSFRIRPIPKQEIRIAQARPQSAKDEAQKDLGQDLDKLAQSIAQAKTTDDKLKTIKQALEGLQIEKIEEGKVDALLEKEKVFAPDTEHNFEGLEVYMNEGWSLKLGNQIFDDTEAAQNFLNIFATLSGQIDIAQEVREYIDLRFDNRVYYR